MPNWCEGTLKIRGDFENLKKFVVEGLIPVNCLGQTLDPLKIEEDDDEDFVFIKFESNNTLYIKGTRRHFCETQYIEFWKNDSEKDSDYSYLSLPMRAAWTIDAEPLQKLCKEYHIDMKIQGFEKGMEFSKIVEIVDGEIVQNQEIEYNDWFWDCPCPDLGG